jgi:antitoxin ParD1/3/4
VDVSLPPELERFVSERVSAGVYDSASAMILEGLRLLQQREAEQRSRLAALRTAIDEGLAAAERGEVVEGEEAFARIRQTSEARERARTAMP